jgi:taurine dioxygenase
MKVNSNLITFLACLYGGAFAEVDNEENLAAPWFGAKPPKKKYEMHRRGWDACLRCGGAERLGATVNVGDLTTIDEEGALEILDAVRAHGIVVIKGQNLTRAEQVEFTSKLGEVIVLPSSFEGKDPEPLHPAIQRITNFWANNTWVSRTEVNGNVNTIVSI